MLVIAGTHDLSDDRRSKAANWRGDIAGARYVELDAAHLSNIEKSDEYTSPCSTSCGEQQ